MLSVVHRSAAFFDLDKTIIARSSALAFGKPFRAGGLINRRAALKAAYAQLVYLVAGADEDQMNRMRDYVTEMCTGWDVQQVKEIVAETLFEIVDPLIYAEAADLIEEHKAAGREVVIVSSSGEEVVSPIGELVGADRVIATRMVVEDGRYTGEVAFYAYGPAKAEAIREVADAAGYDLADCYAYSDSYTDLPMLEAVGHPTAVNPDRALRRAARERDWPVLVFSRPVSMRARLASLRTPRRPMVGTAVGVGAAVVGLAWYAARRRSAGPAPEHTGRSAGERDIGGPAVFRRSLIGRTKDGTEPGSPAGIPSVSWTSGHGRRAPTRDQPREARRVRPWSVAVEMVCTPGNPVRPCAAAPRRRGAVRVPAHAGSRRESAAQDRLADRQTFLRAQLHRGRAVPQPLGDSGPLAGGVGEQGGAVVVRALEVADLRDAHRLRVDAPGDHREPSGGARDHAVQAAERGQGRQLAVHHGGEQDPGCGSVVRDEPGQGGEPVGVRRCGRAAEVLVRRPCRRAASTCSRASACSGARSQTGTRPPRPALTRRAPSTTGSSTSPARRSVNGTTWPSSAAEARAPRSADSLLTAALCRRSTRWLSRRSTASRATVTASATPGRSISGASGSVARGAGRASGGGTPSG